MSRNYMVRKMLRAGTNVLLSNTSLLNKPYKLNFAVTYQCDSRCKTCGIWKKKKLKELTTSQITEFAKNNSFSWINLTGGEPFLRKDLVDIAASFNAPYILNMTTNGLRPNSISNTVQKIISLKIPKTIVVVSLDGGKQLHEKIRGAVGAWDKALNTFSMLSKLSRENSNLKVLFGYTISQYNMNEFEKTFHEAKEVIPELEMKDFHVNLHHVSEHYYSNKKSIHTKVEIPDNGINIIEPMSFMSNRYKRLARSFIETGKTPLPCKSMKSSIFLDPYGNVYPCTIFSKKIGNISDTNYKLKPLLETKKACAILKKVGKTCPQCWSPCEAYQTILGNLPKSLIK